MQRATAPTGPTEVIRGWGGHSTPGHVRLGEDLARLTEHSVLSRGLGRAYGDSALPPADHLVVSGTQLADRILHFDASTGVLRAEAGLSLRELNRLLLRRGWFVPVTPGTQYVTLGGMVAADVHGKNHHVNGTIGEHVRSLRVRVADGRILDCGPDQESELFWGCVGGMGLLGHILEVELAMEAVPSPWIFAETVKAPNIDAFEKLLTESAAQWPMTVGWIDCIKQGQGMGRGILHRGRWATPQEAPSYAPRPKRRLTVPFAFPSFALSRPIVKAFNAVLYHKQRVAVRRKIAHPEDFFYPLDKILHWNRIYGRRGFTQYQCVLPRQAEPGAARRFLEVLTRHGGASFLCVIKDCGPEGRGILSFPKPGISIALDIPMRDNTAALIAALNEVTHKEGGRIYLAKDSLTAAEDFARLEPRLSDFTRLRDQWDPHRKIRSAQSVRLLGDHDHPQAMLPQTAASSAQPRSSASSAVATAASHDREGDASAPSGEGLLRPATP